MAIDKNEIEKYIFDPENPRGCKSYRLLLNIARKNHYSFFSPDFLKYFFAEQIITKEFDEEIWDKPDNYHTLTPIEKLKLFIKINSRNDLFDFIQKIDFKTDKILKFSFVNSLNNFYKDILSDNSEWGEPKDTDISYLKKYILTLDEEYTLDSFSNNIEENKNNIFFSKDYFEPLKEFFTKVSISITLEENIDKFIELNKNQNIKPIFLKKIEDVDLLLNMLEDDLKQEKVKEQYLAPIPYLDAIKIKKYFSIEDMEIIDLKDKKEIYFVGENGDGKTILLQAIILGLKKEYAGDVIEHNRNHKGEIQIAIKDEFSISYEEDINRLNVFAYGINRNKIDAKLFDTYGYSGIFDTSDPRKTTYLKDPFHELGQSYQGDDIFIKDFIKKLNTVILKENYELFNGGDIDFNELSEGYKSTVIWLYDLVSRLVENQKNRDEVKELKDFRAIVLIDEVDLYLHPKWKYDFVENLRKVFSNIQFIMITHSIETILGAGDKAVFYKVYKEEGVTKVYKPMDNIKNLMANALVTSPLFDMDTARAKHHDNKLDTREDFISSKIHRIMKERLKGKKAIVEDDIMEMINQELDDYLKKNDL
ncbi:MAG: AAA family ATPase [Sulfurovum sp.]